MSAIEEARMTAWTLLRKYGITELNMAHRLIRDRFTQSDLDKFQAAVKTLDGNGVID